MSYIARHEGVNAWADLVATTSAIDSFPNNYVWDVEHPLRTNDGTSSVLTRTRMYAAIGRAIGRDLGPDNKRDKSAAIAFLAEGLPNSKTDGNGVARENAAKYLRKPDTMTHDQVVWFCMATGASLDYLRGHVDSHEATLEAGNAAQLSKIYDRLSYERRRALWAVAAALIEQEESELKARRVIDFEPLPEDIKTINDLAAHPEFSRPIEDDDGRL